MPELPEVEITRRHLDEVMAGRVLTEVTVSHARTSRHNGSPREVEHRLQGRRVESVGRRGKFLMARLDDGQTLVAHLGMSGRFAIEDPKASRAPHTHFRALLDDGVEIRFVDPRTFGFVAVFTDDELESSGVARLGPDAWLDLPGVEDLSASLSRRSAPIKALLLDQGPIAGLGNIYADEALFLARIHPLRPGNSLTVEELGRLREAIREVLGGAIANGGTSLDDLAYLLPDGRAGENLDRLNVYDREDLPCPGCGAPIRRIVIRSRSSYFCPACQPEPN